jgi:hypothetical protein
MQCHVVATRGGRPLAANEFLKSDALILDT